MKRLFALFMVTVTLMTFCACGRNKEKPEVSNSIEETNRILDENETEPASENLLQDEQNMLGNEDPDIETGTAVEETEIMNTRSVRRLREGGKTADFRSVIKQGSTLYLACCNRLGKMPVDGSVDDVEILLGREFCSHNNIREIQVVGEWIYIRTDEGGNELYNVNSLWRVRTDGTDLERITNVLAMDERKRNTFAVMGNMVYFTCIFTERLSASEYKYTSVLFCDNPDTGDSVVLYETVSDSSNMNLIITSYNERSLLLLDFSEDKKNPTLLIYEYDDSVPFVAPEALQEMMLAEKYYYCVFYDDMSNTGSYLAENNETLYRISPDNNYVPEELPIALFHEDGNDRSIHELLIVDDKTFIYSYWLEMQGHGIRMYHDGTITDINSDRATHLDYPGDGYLYYSYQDGWERDHHCRVQIDGGGWEQLDWEFAAEK